MTSDQRNRREDLASRVMALSPGEKFTLAAQLIHAGKFDLAETIGEQAVQQLQAQRLLGKVEL